MSLIKQLWIAITLVMTLAFGMSMVVSVLSARHYLEQQLQLKNIDNATALALSLTQLPKDKITVELQVAAQFDAGHYQFIRVTSPQGSVLVEKVAGNPETGAPIWFTRLVPIHAEPGRALVQDGWLQYGTLSLASQDSYAYQSLWSGVLQLLGWFVAGGILTGLVGSQLVRIITRPLAQVVDQASAIAQRQFITIDEPRTPELRSVAHAMNDMVERVKNMFTEEAARLDTLRNKTNRDAVTELDSRDYFFSHLREALEGEQSDSSGSLVLVRLHNLDDLNTQLGHQQTDALLKDIGSALDSSCTSHTGWRAGRIKGTEFAVLCPGFETAQAAAQCIAESLLQRALPHWQAQVADLFHVGAVRYHRLQSMASLLSSADAALAQASNAGANNCYAAEDGSAKLAVPAEQWRTLLTKAVSGGQLTLNFFPVMAGDGAHALHSEGVIRLQTDDQGTILTAGDFMPMAAQLNLTGPIDLGVVKLAIEHLLSTKGDIAVNLSAQTMADFNFRNALIRLLKTYPSVCQRLLFEVPEYGVFQQFDAFCELARGLKLLGCRVGIEYFGQRFAESDKLASLGLDYIKVHPSYIHDLMHNPGNQEFLQGLSKMAHAMGITVLALGVQHPDELALLASLGFDGATGPGIR